MELRLRPTDPVVNAAALAEGYSTLQAGIIARRLSESSLLAHGSVRACIAPTLAAIAPPEGLAEIDIACDRITRAIDAGEHIALVVDHDADGQSSLSVMYRALVDVFGVDPSRLHPFCTWRLIEGYGISDLFVDRVLAHTPRPTLVISGDQGSSNGPQITRLLAASVETIVSDHHALPLDGLPTDAVACVTPQHPDNRYPDKAIAGCMVAWLLMARMRQRWIQEGRLASTHATSLVPLLDYVAIGTAADAADLAASPINRAVVAHGLVLINQNKRPAWRALRACVQGDNPVPLITEDLLFQYCPLD